MSRRIKFTVIIFIAVLLYACDSSRVYEENIAVTGAIWNKDSLARFDVRISDTRTPHNVYINVRNMGDYRFKNLFLFITVTSPAGNSVKDTFDCVLADDRGKWYGSGIGDLYDNQILYKGNIIFPDTGIYTFQYEQAMRMDKWGGNLEGISDIGLRVEKMK
ncbi:MAG: gliding motility lipoprotein GldH [Bacteroidota bacterium]